MLHSKRRKEDQLAGGRWHGDSSMEPWSGATARELGNGVERHGGARLGGEGEHGTAMPEQNRIWGQRGAARRLPTWQRRGAARWRSSISPQRDAREGTELLATEGCRGDAGEGVELPAAKGSGGG